MSDKPTILPRWADQGGAKVATPSSGKQDIGWDTQEKPPAQWFNWLKLHTYNWLEWISAGYLTRASLVIDAPIQAQTDQDANVKDWIDANGYNCGQVISEQYWWSPPASFNAADSMSMGAPFYLTAEDSPNYVVTTAAPPSTELGCNMVFINCPAAPTATNGVIVSCDDASTGGEVFSNLDDAIAVFETHFITEQTTNSASTFYAGFHDPQGNPGNFESASIGSCCLILDYGETVFEGMTCDATTLSKSTTSTTCTVNTLYHIRVEYHGANTPQGVDAGGAVARFFIDGVLVLEKTTNLPINAEWLGPCFGVQGLGSDTQADIYVGPVRWSVNYVDSSQVPTV